MMIRETLCGVGIAVWRSQCVCELKFAKVAVCRSYSVWELWCMGVVMCKSCDVWYLKCVGLRCMGIWGVRKFPFVGVAVFINHNRIYTYLKTEIWLKVKRGTAPLKPPNVKYFWFVLPRHPPWMARHPSVTPGALLRSPKPQKTLLG